MEPIHLAKYFPKSNTIHILQPGVDPKMANPEEMLTNCSKVAPFEVIPADEERDVLALVSCRPCRAEYMAQLKTAPVDSQPRPAAGGLTPLLQAVAWSGAWHIGFHKAASTVTEALLASYR